MHIEGIVIKITPFADYDKILTVLTEQGLIKIYAKLGRKSPIQKLALTGLLNRCEFILLESKTELYKLKEGSVLDAHLGLRQSLNRLLCAQQMASALLHHLWPGKPCPQLYRLFAAFLKKTSESDLSLLTPFLVKLWVHEGEADISVWDSTEQKLFNEIALTRHLEQFPEIPASFEKKIYSKVMRAPAA
jgi:DNA repair protein RecO (recombination protein O)